MCDFILEEGGVDDEAAVRSVTVTPNVDLKSLCLDLGLL